MKALEKLMRDTVRGLGQRRLWPVAAVLVVALVAIPAVLTAQPAPAPEPATDVAGSAVEPAPEPIVAVASASEREQVRRVLGKRKDPFRPSASPKRDNEESDRAASESAGDDAGAKATEGAGTSGAPGAGSVTIQSPQPAPVPTHAPDSTPERRHAAWSLTVRWGAADAEELDKSDVERLAAVPSEEEPVLIYVGLTDKGRTAVFMVEAGVTADGDGRCRPDSANCETVELSRGETEFFEVTDDNGEVEQYRLDLVAIHRPKSAGGDKTAAAAARLGGERVRTGERLRSGVTRRRAAARVRDAERVGYRHDASTGLLEPVDGDA